MDWMRLLREREKQLRLKSKNVLIWKTYRRRTSVMGDLKKKGKKRKNIIKGQLTATEILNKMRLKVVHLILHSAGLETLFQEKSLSGQKRAKDRLKQGKSQCEAYVQTTLFVRNWAVNSRNGVVNGKRCGVSRDFCF